MTPPSSDSGSSRPTVLLIVLFAALVVVPLLPVLPLALAPDGRRIADFDTQKWAVLELLLIAGIVAVALRSLFRREIALPTGVVPVTLLAAVLIHFALFPFAPRPAPSLQRCFEVLALTGAFVAVLGVAGSPKNRLPILLGLGLGIGFVALFGCLQKVGLELPGMGAVGSDLPPPKAVSTIGNTNTAGAVLVPGLCLGVGLYLGASGWTRAGLALGVSALIVVHLHATSSRGAWIAATLGVLTVLAASILHRENRRHIARRIALLAGVGAIGLTLFLLLGDSESLWRRIRSIPSSEHNTNIVRASFVRGSLALFAENPFLGTGPGSFPDVYPAHRDPEEVLISGYDRVVLSAHNEWLELLVEGGLLLALPGLCLAVYALSSAVRSVRRQENGTPPWISWALAGALVGIGTIGLFRSILRNPALALATVTVLALLVSPSVSWRRVRLSPLVRIGIVALTLVLSLALGREMRSRFRSDDHAQRAQFRRAELALLDSDPETTARELRSSLEGLERELRLAHEARPSDLDLARKRLFLARDMGRGLNSRAKLEEGVSLARDILGTHPQDRGVRITLSVLLITLGRSDEARTELEELARRFPWDPRAPDNLALLAADRGDEEEAKRHLATMVKIDRSYATSRHQALLDTPGRERLSIHLFRLLHEDAPPGEPVP